MEEFNNLFNSNLIGPCLAIVLLIGYIFILSMQRLNYGRNITKLITIKGDKGIYLKYSN
jgi:hypothetical protein